MLYSHYECPLNWEYVSGNLVCWEILGPVGLDILDILLDLIYTMSQKKLCKLIFCQNIFKFRPIVEIFGTEIAKRTNFSEVYSFSTSPNLCQRTTVLNADVPNCYTTL